MSLRQIPPPLPIFSTLFGVSLIALGWLLIERPQYLAYIVAGLLIFVGAATIVGAWSFRGRARSGSQFVSFWRTRDQ